MTPTVAKRLEWDSGGARAKCDWMNDRYCVRPQGDGWIWFSDVSRAEQVQDPPNFCPDCGGRVVINNEEQ